MITLKNILLPTDLSESSLVANGTALELARAFDATLHLLYVIEEPVFYMPAFGGYVPNRDQFEAFAKTALKNWISAEDAKGLNIVRHQAFGNPLLQILSYVQDNDIDLIVMGTHGRSAIKHVLIGSVSQNVVRKSPCPVLTVKPSDHTFSIPD